MFYDMKYNINSWHIFHIIFVFREALQEQCGETPTAIVFCHFCLSLKDWKNPFCYGLNTDFVIF